VVVYKPKNSPYFHYDFHYKGQRHYGSTNLKTKKSAQEIEDTVRADASRDYHIGPKKTKPTMTVAQVFYKYWKQKAIEFEQANEYLRRFKLMAVLLGPDLPFHEVDDNRLADMIEKIAERTRPVKGGGKKKITNATVNHYLTLFGQVWRLARKSWKIEVADEPIWEELRKTRSAPRIRELSPDEESRLMAVLREDLRPMVNFKNITGLRFRNLAKLKWTEIHWEAGQITVPGVKSRLKGGKFHTIPITPAMAAILESVKGHHEEFVFTYVCQRNRAGVRVKGNRHPFSYTGFIKPWKAGLAEAGIENYREHDGRHTAATRTLRASKSLKAVQQLLGHASITSTMIYAQLLTDDVRDALVATENQNSPERETSNDE
jgi:integrase